MNKLIVISPKACQESAKRLAQALNCQYENPYKTGRYIYLRFDKVINYGYSKKFIADSIINNTFAVSTCIDKHATLLALSRKKLPIPEFTSDILTASQWPENETVVCHTVAEGRKNNGIEYNSPNELVPAYLYTKYFHHKREYRVVVLMNKVVGIYSKIEKDGEWDLVSLKLRGFDSIIKACEQASKELLIHYVGFDVVAKTREDFVILEANSGPILTQEAIDGFKKLLKVD